MKILAMKTFYLKNEMPSPAIIKSGLLGKIPKRLKIQLRFKCQTSSRKLLQIRAIYFDRHGKLHDKWIDLSKYQYLTAPQKYELRCKAKKTL